MDDLYTSLQRIKIYKESTTNINHISSNYPQDNLGEPSLKKNGKIWEKFPIRLDPPPLG